MPVIDPTKLTVLTVNGTLTTIGAAVQTELRTSVPTAAEMYDIEYVRSAQDPSRVTAYIFFEAP